MKEQSKNQNICPFFNKVHDQNIVLHNLERNQSFFQTWEVFVLYSICKMLYRISSKFSLFGLLLDLKFSETKFKAK